MSIETQSHTTNGAAPAQDWADLHEEEGLFSLDLLERPEVIAGVAFVGGLLVALLIRRLTS